MLTPNPINMIDECFRVLKPGGLAGFSVMGRPENTTSF